MGKKVEYKRERHEVSDATTPWDMKFNTVRQGWKLTIQHVSVENEDTGFTELKIGYETERGVLHWWVSQESPQAGVLYWMDKQKVLTEGMQLVIRFDTTTDGDDLYAYVDGYEEKMD
ncbi:hypothetical protein ES703_120441 [subsurface metagenome]